MLNKSATLLGAVTGICLLAGCGGSSAADGAETSVVAGFYPFAYVAERVAGGHASVANLTETGAEPHELELSPQQVAEVAEADVVVYERGFQPSLDEAVDENENGVALEITEVVSPHGAETPGDEHGHDHKEHDHHHDHGDLSGDPHIWQDPTKLIEVAHATADALADADPDHAADYRANADALITDLKRLDRAYRRGLADCERRVFVTSHAAFGHLARRYDLEMIAISGLSPDQEPSLARLRELRRLAEEKGVTTVFSETLTDARLSETLADEVGIKTAVLDPIEGLTDETADEDYLSLMRSNLESLRKANECR